MTGVSPPGAHSPGRHGGGSQSAGPSSDHRELWPREYGRDGVSGLVTLDRAMRARDVSRPGPAEEEIAEELIAVLLARVDGRRTPSRA